MKLKFLSWVEKHAINLIMLLAFAVRMIGFRWMGNTDFPEFYRDYYMVSRIAHGQMVLLGPPSMLHGFHFGPFYYYSMVPMFQLFYGHPFGLIFTGIIFSVLTVYAFYKILLLWFNSRGAAITGALFMALSVYSLHLTSYVSNPNFLPLFVLWYFYYLTKILADGGKLADYVYLGLAFGLSTQLHATAMIVLPLVTLTTLVVNKYRPKLKTAGIFLAAAVFTYLPYLFYEFTNRFANFKRLFVLGSKELNGQHYGSGAAAIWNFFQGTLTPFNYWYFYTNIQPNFLYAVVALFATVAVGAILYRIFKNPRPAQSNFKISKIGGTIVLSWTVWTCAVLLLFARGVHDHYIIILWPVPLVLLIYLVFWMKAKFGVFYSLTALVVITSLLQIYSFYQLGHTPWSNFMPTYQSKYQNDPSVPEIGS
jgi:4-amino-4-deoxy-L-arabinose transferase-like glycosyltransferase